MFSLLSDESGCAALWASISCESRNAHAIPAGPPPTITTSAGIWGRSMPSSGLRKISIQNCEALTACFSLFYFFNQRWHHIKKISHHCVIRDFKDWGFRIFIYCDDCPRAFHAYDVLDSTADAQ